MNKQYIGIIIVVVFLALAMAIGWYFGL